MGNQKNLWTVGKNLPIALSAVALVCLFYNGSNDFFMGMLATVVLYFSWRVCRWEDSWNHLWKNRNVTVVLLSVLTAAVFAAGFFQRMVGSDLIVVLCNLLGKGAWKLTAAIAAALGVGALPVLLLGCEWLEKKTRTYQRRNVESAMPYGASLSLKGIMILAMVSWHAIRFPSWILPEVNFPEVPAIMIDLVKNTLIFAGCFAFLTGYTYAWHKDKSFRYSWRKIRGFVGTYLLVLALMVLVGVIFCGYRITAMDILLEALTVNSNVQLFNWYVRVYVITMLMLPLAARYTKERGLLWEIAGFVLVWLLAVALRWVLPEDFWLGAFLKQTCMYFPCSAAGYFLARYQLLDRAAAWVKGRLPAVLRVILGAVLFCGTVWLYDRTYNVEVLDIALQRDFYLIPGLMLGYVLVWSPRLKMTNRVLGILGRYSMEMWFLHAIFFADATKEVFQPIGYFPRNPVLVICWIAALSLGAAMLTSRLYGLITGGKKKKTSPVR